MIDAYLLIEGIKGESTDDKHKDWIEVEHVLWGVHQPRAATVSTAGGHTSGRAELRSEQSLLSREASCHFATGPSTPLQAS